MPDATTGEAAKPSLEGERARTGSGPEEGTEAVRETMVSAGVVVLAPLPEESPVEDGTASYGALPSSTRELAAGSLAGASGAVGLSEASEAASIAAICSVRLVKVDVIRIAALND